WPNEVSRLATSAARAQVGPWGRCRHAGILVAIAKISTLHGKQGRLCEHQIKVLRGVDLIRFVATCQVHSVACLRAAVKIRTVPVVGRQRAGGLDRRKQKRSVCVEAPAAVADFTERLRECLTPLDCALIGAGGEL